MRQLLVVVALFLGVMGTAEARPRVQVRPVATTYRATSRRATSRRAIAPVVGLAVRGAPDRPQAAGRLAAIRPSAERTLRRIAARIRTAHSATTTAPRAT